METLDRLRQVTGPAFALLLDPLCGSAPIWSATALAFLAALLVLIVYRLCSSAPDLERAKCRVKAYLLELRLFQDHPGLVARAACGGARANLSYLRLHAKPLTVLALPVALVLLEGQARLDRRPFLPGEGVLLQSFWPRDVALEADGLPDLIVPQGLRVESPPLRIPQKREIDWRLRAQALGLHRLALRGSWGEGFVEVAVSERPEALKGSVGSFLRQRSPGAAAGSRKGPAPGPLLLVEHPRSFLDLAGFHASWVWMVLVESMVFVYVLKGRFGVEF